VCAKKFLAQTSWSRWQAHTNPSFSCPASAAPMRNAGGHAATSTTCPPTLDALPCRGALGTHYPLLCYQPPATTRSTKLALS
jgi:hypothetical protein